MRCLYGPQRSVNSPVLSRPLESPCVCGHGFQPVGQGLQRGRRGERGNSRQLRRRIGGNFEEGEVQEEEEENDEEEERGSL